jgi:uncharacterized protein YndB with AHSA1/START domain
MRTPLQFVFYVVVKPEKLWEGLVSPESNRIILTGADFEADVKPGGSMKWIGPGADGKPATLVKGEILQSDPPKFASVHFSTRAESVQISSDCGTSQRLKPQSSRSATISGMKGILPTHFALTDGHASSPG